MLHTCVTRNHLIVWVWLTIDCRLGTLWVDAHDAVTKAYEALKTLFEALEGFLGFFDLL